MRGDSRLAPIPNFAVSPSPCKIKLTTLHLTGVTPMPAKPKTKRARRKAKYEWDSDKVKALREHMGLTQTEFAEELGTLQQTVSEWECGNHYPKGLSVRMLSIIAEKANFKYGEAPPKTAS